MIELEIYFYFALGECVYAVKIMQPNWPDYFKWTALSELQKALSTFKDNPERSKAFPATAAIAIQLSAEIQEFIPINPPTTPVYISKEHIDSFREKCTKLEAKFVEESDASYVLKVENQRHFSEHILIEKIEDVVSRNTWLGLSPLARREIAESGRCLAVERYTSCGFHVLRCVEAVIREYIAALGVTLKDAERNWGQYVRHLADNGAAKEASHIVDTMREDDRNTLMHPEKFLSQDEAIGVFCLSLTALDRLITDMRNGGHAKIYPVTAPLP
jgi:hypothetical protein